MKECLEDPAKSMQIPQQKLMNDLRSEYDFLVREISPVHALYSPSQ